MICEVGEAVLKKGEVCFSSLLYPGSKKVVPCKGLLMPSLRVVRGA